MARRIKASFGMVAWAGILVAVAPLVACGGGDDDDASASTNGNGGGGNTPAAAAATATPTPPPVVEIKVTDNAFEPGEITVARGTAVKWVWSGANPHSVLVNGSKSEEMTGSGDYTVEFKSGAGIFNFQCGVHGAAMAGKVIVE